MIIQNTTKENLSLLADLSEPWRVKFISIWLQYQKCVYWQTGWNTVAIFKKQEKWSQHHVKPSTYIKHGVGNNEEDPNLKDGDHITT